MLTRTQWGRILAVGTLLVLVAAALWSYLQEGIVWSLIAEGTPADRVEAVKAYFAQFGAFGPLAYMVAVTLEVVVAPIPGTALYLPGGVVFGWFVGGSMALLGNVLGSGIACSLSRLALSGVSALESEPGRKLRSLIERRGVLIIFLLRLNPLTSSDLVSYAAGGTSISTLRVMLGTGLGMLPLCYAQAYFAEGLVTVFPWLIYAIVPLCVGYLVFAVVVVVRAYSPAD